MIIKVEIMMPEQSRDFHVELGVLRKDLPKEQLDTRSIYQPNRDYMTN